MRLWRGIEIHLAGNAREAPEVLVLQIGAVAPAHHLHGYQVIARLHIFGDVKLGGHLRVLRVAHVLAVHPHGEVARGRADMEINLLSLPILRQAERAAVRARIVVGLPDVGRVALEGGTPGIAHVLIGLVAIAVQLEEPGHGEVGPLRVVILQREEVLRRILMVLHKAELPQALHREKSRGLRLVVRLCLALTLEGKEMGAPRLTVHLVHIGVLPYGQLLRIGRGQRQTGH